MMIDDIEIRCPNGVRGLLAKLKSNGEKPKYVANGMLVEFACYDCKNRLRKRGQLVRRVLHQYNFLGDLVATVIEE
jgi:hypothetical protein